MNARVEFCHRRHIFVFHLRLFFLPPFSASLVFLRVHPSLLASVRVRSMIPSHLSVVLLSALFFCHLCGVNSSSRGSCRSLRLEERTPTNQSRVRLKRFESACYQFPLHHKQTKRDSNADRHQYNAEQSRHTPGENNRKRTPIRVMNANTRQTKKKSNQVKQPTNRMYVCSNTMTPK